MQEATTDAYIPANHSVMCHPSPVNDLKRKNKPTFPPNPLEHEKPGAAPFPETLLETFKLQPSYLKLRYMDV